MADCDEPRRSESTNAIACPTRPATASKSVDPASAAINTTRPSPIDDAAQGPSRITDAPS